MKNFALQLTFWSLCLGALVFPFSVALTNAAFGTAIILSAITGQFLQGFNLTRHRHTPLLFAIAAYLSLMLLGLLWSQDIDYGFKVLSHQWVWLMLPVLTVISLDDKSRDRLLTFLSIGLTLHLIYCLLQRFDIVPSPDIAGSGIHDATGYIGHIGFGFVYAVWGGWLLHRGCLQTGWMRWGHWLLASWAFMMIFLAQGRSGYLVAIAILLTLFLKNVAGRLGWKRSMIAVGLISVVLLVIVSGPAKDRIQETRSGISAAMQGDIEHHAAARWVIWYGTVKILESSPLLGVGTGGFPISYSEIIQQFPELDVYDGKGFHHPHNIYLQSMVRWGITGAVVLLVLLTIWLRVGWRVEWMKKPDSSLIILSCIAVLIHGLSAASLEEHFPAVLAIFMLGVGLGSSESEQKPLSG